MLFRAVLATAALSCTFPLALARIQGTQLVQIKDLVCVLWLTGLKKEDLDVNLLRNLHRHNINIDDIMNKETMRHECAARVPESSSRTKLPLLKMKLTASLSTTLDPAKSANATRDKYIDTIVNLISTAQSINGNLSEERKYDKTGNSQNNNNKQTILQPKPLKADISFQTEAKREIEVESENLKLQQNILNFWKKMLKTEMPRNVDEELSTLPVVSSKDMFRQRHISRPEPKLTTPPPNFTISTPQPYFTTSTPLQSYDIEKLITQFISKMMAQVSTTTTTQSNMPDNLAFLPFYRDLIKSYKSRQSTENGDDSQVKANTFEEIPKLNFINYKETTTEKPQGFERIYVPFNNILQNKGQMSHLFKNKMPDMLPKVPKYIEDIASKKREIVRNKETLSDDTNVRNFLRLNTRVNKEQSQNIAKNTLQNIAESVKALVLKDIGNLITSRTPSLNLIEMTAPPLLSTKSTLKISQGPITTPKPQDRTNASHVMEKILEIYQRIKAISDKTELSLDARYKQVSVNQEHGGPSNQPPNTNIILRSNNVNKVVMNQTPFRDLTQQEMKQLPSIIQTNSGEIPPLVLPMSKSLKIVNEIVVMTTERPAPKNDVKSRYESLMDDLTKNKVLTVGNKEKYQKYERVPSPERVPSLDRVPSHERAPILERLPSLERILSHDRILSRDRVPGLERVPSLDRVSSHERAPSLERLPSFGRILSHDRILSRDGVPVLDRVSSLERVPSLERLPNLERVPSFERLPSLERDPSLGRAPRHERVPSLERAPSHETYFGYADLKHSHKEYMDIPSKHTLLSSELYDQPHRYKKLYRDFANGEKRSREEREHINYFEHVLGHNDVEKIPWHRHEEKFHERLEKGDERWGDNRQGYMANERDRGYGRHVVPRYQQPLSKSKPSFDDTHFRNFLKTQEKVNDMLEKILGKKATENYSVETT